MISLSSLSAFSTSALTGSVPGSTGAATVLAPATAQAAATATVGRRSSAAVQSVASRVLSGEKPAGSLPRGSLLNLSV